MATPTRTYGPLHFEDLDPHRFEDLVRELIYDYKGWQSIEATGRSGADAGVDIRAYERASDNETEREDEDTEAAVVHPMLGNRWLIQCKREKEIGPKKLESIVDEVELADPPYGYILAAACVFSRQSYDAFREALLKKGVMEFYLWGKPELEDMLHLPKNDRILFTFFGISLVSKRRSRSTEIRFSVTNKNKLYRIFGDEIGAPAPVLLRDSKDNHYPYKKEYKDFDERPRWKEFPAAEYHPLGLLCHVRKHFAFVDEAKKEFDFAPAVSLLFLESESHDDRQRQQHDHENVEDFWDHLPRRNQATYVKEGLVRYDEMLVIDPKGDHAHKFAHIFVDFEGASGPFSGFVEYAEQGDRSFGGGKAFYLRDWKRVEIFPQSFERPKMGKVYRDRLVDVPDQNVAMFASGGDAREFFDAAGTYAFLEPRDIIGIADPKNSQAKRWIEITYKRKISAKEYLTDSADPLYAEQQLEQRTGRKLKPSEKFMAYEFKETYEWKFERSEKR